MNGSNETASKNTIDLLLSIGWLEGFASTVMAMTNVRDGRDRQIVSIEMYEEYCRKVAEIVDIVGIGAQR